MATPPQIRSGIRAAAPSSQDSVASANLAELGNFIRSRRALLRPEQEQLGRTPRRKTPGLRREELAALAGISSSWYTRIELGATDVPSSATLYAIAQALRLDETDRRYLFELAGLPLPPRRLDGELSPTLEHVVLSLKDAAATVFDRYGTPRCWNAIADALFRWSLAEDEFHRSSIVAGLTNPYFRDFFGADFEPVARGVIGSFRRAFTTFEPTPLARRIFEFGMSVPLFRSIWNESSVAEAFTAPGPFLRTAREVGELWLDHIDLFPAGRQDVFIRALSAHDPQTLSKLSRLHLQGTAKGFSDADSPRIHDSRSGPRLS